MRGPDTHQHSIPCCLAPRTKIMGPRFSMPVGAWDTHFHILGPQARFPYASNRKYTPPDASIEQYRTVQRTLGLCGGFVVHANTHGFDNEVDIDAAKQLGAEDHFAVVRVDSSVDSGRISAWHTQGVRGVRFAFNPQHGGDLDKALLQRTVELISDYGWFVELHAAPQDLVKLAPWLSLLDVRIVIDHIGRIDAALGTEQPAFEALQNLVSSRDVWVKLSGIDRLTKVGPPYADVVPFTRQLMRLAPERMIWGSDWPHTGIFENSRMPDDADLLNFVAEYAPNDELRTTLFVDNPRRLLRL